MGRQRYYRDHHLLALPLPLAAPLNYLCHKEIPGDGKEGDIHSLLPARPQQLLQQIQLQGMPFSMATCLTLTLVLDHYTRLLLLL